MQSCKNTETNTCCQLNYFDKNRQCVLGFIKYILYAKTVLKLVYMFSAEKLSMSIVLALNDLNQTVNKE